MDRKELKKRWEFFRYLVRSWSSASGIHQTQDEFEMNMRLLGATTIKGVDPKLVDISNISSHVSAIPGDRLYDNNCELVPPHYQLKNLRHFMIDENMQHAQLKVVAKLWIHILHRMGQDSRRNLLQQFFVHVKVSNRNQQVRSISITLHEKLPNNTTHLMTCTCTICSPLYYPSSNSCVIYILCFCHCLFHTLFWMYVCSNWLGSSWREMNFVCELPLSKRPCRFKQERWIINLFDQSFRGRNLKELGNHSPL